VTSGDVKMMVEGTGSGPLFTFYSRVIPILSPIILLCATMTNVTDVLLVIFDYVSRYTANHIDQRELTSSHSRNQTLAACARVCRSWSVPALAVLYRDIALGQVVRTCTTDGARSSLVDEEQGASAPPGEGRGPDPPERRRLDHGHHRQADRPRVGFTGPALQRLVQTLHSFHRAGSQIPARIRSLHLGIGCLTPSSHPGIIFVTHSAPRDVARLIALCPQLQHLSIINGHPFIDQPNQPLIFEHEDLAVLEASIARQTLRTVCLNNAKPTGLLEAFPHLDHAVPTAAFQLLRIFAPSITATRLDINVRYADFIGSPAVFDLPLMPNLARAVVLGRIPEDVQEVLDHAPGLKRLVFVQHHQTKETRVLRAPALEQLVVRHLYDRLDMSALHALRSLRVICSGVTKNLVQTVRLAPASVQDLWIDMFTNTLDPLSFDNWFDERVSARHLSLALQQRTSVQRLITVQGQTTQQTAWHSRIGIPISTNPNVCRLFYVNLALLTCCNVSSEGGTETLSKGSIYEDRNQTTRPG